MKKMVVFALTGALGLTGCSVLENNPIYGEQGIIHDRSKDYLKAAQGTRLVFPETAKAKQVQDSLTIPEIGDTATDRLSDFSAPRPTFFYADTTTDKVDVARKDGHKLIMVDSDVEHVWQQIQDFWAYNNVQIAKADPVSRVMETEWIRNTPESTGLLDGWLKKLTFSTDSSNVEDKLRIELSQNVDERGRTAINMRHIRRDQKSKDQPLDWSVQSNDVGYQSDMMFEMLRYLSRAAQAEDAPSLVRYSQKSIGALYQIGRDSTGRPVLKINQPIDEAWLAVSQAMSKDNWDVGTRDKNKGIIYLSFTSKLPVAERENQGFFAWLHSDREEIKLSTSFLGDAFGGDDSAKGNNEIFYTKKSLVSAEQPNEDGTLKTAEQIEQERLANSDGFKIWFGDKVVYVFGGGEAKKVETDGAVELTAPYQLHFNRTRTGVYLSVLTDKEEAASVPRAEEMLWTLKEALTKLY